MEEAAPMEDARNCQSFDGKISVHLLEYYKNGDLSDLIKRMVARDVVVGEKQIIKIFCCRKSLT